MRVLRTKEQVDKIKKKKEKAIEGCEVCPCCGKKEWVDWQRHSHIAFTLKGFVEKERRYYKCRLCGAMWRSGSYIVEDKYGEI